MVNFERLIKSQYVHNQIFAFVKWKTFQHVEKFWMKYFAGSKIIANFAAQLGIKE